MRQSASLGIVTGQGRTKRIFGNKCSCRWRDRRSPRRPRRARHTPADEWSAETDFKRDSRHVSSMSPQASPAESRAPPGRAPGTVNRSRGEQN
ncbi:hypothetical protein EVAR_3135_1 [Eumeta japonica]|uniref:Uncharacterized protein n=1 Tax=Eumeta variegata TaxID=151549 RepID=A0A4C1XGZ0_EUMVA|nr:hypothetical protein EVAR_3135_1 [Eumeta japonica]